MNRNITIMLRLSLGSAFVLNCFSYQAQAVQDNFGIPPVQPQVQPQFPGTQPANLAPQDDFGQLPPDSQPTPGIGQLPAGQTPSFSLPTEPDQPIVVNEKYAGWRQAADGSTGTRLSDEIRANWVMADPNGGVDGQILKLDDADLENFRLYLLDNGRVVAQTKPNDLAQFKFANVRQGAYAIVGFGKNAFFTFGLNVLRHSPAASEDVPRSLKITAVGNETTINLDWIRHFSTSVNFRVYGRHETREGSEDPARLYGYDGLSTHFPTAKPATSISSHPVNLTSDGRLIGRVHQFSSFNGRPVDLQSTRVLLLQNDDVYTAVTVDNYGVFELTEVPAGEYSLVAVGADGVACIGINVGEAGEAGDSTAMPIDLTLAPAEAIGWLSHTATEAAYQRIVSRERPNTGMNNNNPGMCQTCMGAGHGCGACGGSGVAGCGGRTCSPNCNARKWFRDFSDWVDELFYGNGSYNGYGTGYGTGYGNGSPHNGYQNNGGYYNNGYNGGYQNGYPYQGQPGNYYGAQRVVPRQYVPQR